MDIQIIKPDTAQIEEVRKLGDSLSKTVGFFPYEIYIFHAQKGWIIGAFEEDTLVGYIMYRITKDITSIAQLCVLPQHRGKGIAKSLVDYLYLQTKHTRGLQLNCRRDYGISDIWKALGFTPLSEKPGRATRKNTTLTTWFRAHKQDDLFALAESQKNDKRIVAVLDTNIVIDLVDESVIESTQLLAPYLQALVKYKISPNVLHEIDTQPNPIIRKESRRTAKQFDIIDITESCEYKSISDYITKNISGETSSNTKYDISNISHAIVAGASAYITRDNTWLMPKFSDLIFQEYGIKIYSPGEFVLSIDELYGESDYVPIRLSGLGLQYSKMTTEDLRMVSSDLLNSKANEKLRELKSTLRNLMSNPQNNEIYVIKNEKVLVGIFAFSKHRSRINIELMRISSKEISVSLQSTFIKRIAFKLMEKAVTLSATIIVVPLAQLCSSIAVESFIACGFSFSEEYVYKVILTGIIDANKINEEVSKVLLDWHGSDVNITLPTLQDSEMSAYQIVTMMKMLWPLKVNCNVLNCYIVPIKPEYAIQLFDEDLANTNLSLFTNEKTVPALSMENVYFKSAKNALKDHPAIILWYVSASENLMGTSAIRACSYLDAVEINSAKILFNKYNRLGVLNWNHILKICNHNPCENIACYKFSYTEIFEHAIPYSNLREYIKMKYNKNISLQCHYQVTVEDFCNIYQHGTLGRALNV